MKKILIIDDDEQIIRILKVFLDENGYETCTASDGKEGGDKMETFRPDLAIVDILMPEIDGLEFIRSQRNPSTHKLNCKIIAMSAGGHISKDKYLSLAEGFGVDATIRKPIEFPELLLQIQALLS